MLILYHYHNSLLAGLRGDESEAESEIEKGREACSWGKEKKGDESEEVREREERDRKKEKKKKKTHKHTHMFLE